MISQERKLIEVINAVDNVPLDFEQNFHPYYRLYIAPDPRPHGYIHPDTVSRMPWPPSFVISHNSRSVILSPPVTAATTASSIGPSGDTPASSKSLSSSERATLSAHACSAFQQAIDAAIEENNFPILNQRHSEPFLVVGARAFISIERFAATLFGIVTRGAHMTAFVREAPSRPGDQGRIKIWVARRSRSLFTYPGMLDSTVAGGVKAHDTPMDCIIDEAQEEACLPLRLVQREGGKVTEEGVITLGNQNKKTGLYHSEMLYVFDLEMELPPDGVTRGTRRTCQEAAASQMEEEDGRGEIVIPRPGDEEVEEFILMDCDEVRRRMLDGEFKPNVCPVMVDFMVRHGVLDDLEEDELNEIRRRLRRKLPVPIESDI